MISSDKIQSCYTKTAVVSGSKKRTCLSPRDGEFSKLQSCFLCLHSSMSIKRGSNIFASTVSNSFFPLSTEHFPPSIFHKRPSFACALCSSRVVGFKGNAIENCISVVRMFLPRMDVTFALVRTQPKIWIYVNILFLLFMFQFFFFFCCFSLFVGRFSFAFPHHRLSDRIH